jgi:hypothetical protein
MTTRSHIPIPNRTLTKKPVSRLMRGGSLKPVSAKTAKLKKIYNALVKDMLKRHPWCQHWLAENKFTESDVSEAGVVYRKGPPEVWMQVPRSAECHHRKGRGKYYLDTSTWMMVRPGHSIYIHLDPLRYEKGYCLPRN